MLHDRFGNPIDENGHDILDDDFDPELYSDEELGFEEEFIDEDEIAEDWDDFDPELEWPEDFYYDNDSDLGNEF